VKTVCVVVHRTRSKRARTAQRPDVCPVGRGTTEDVPTVNAPIRKEKRRGGLGLARECIGAGHREMPRTVPAAAGAGTGDAVRARRHGASEIGDTDGVRLLQPRGAGGQSIEAPRGAGPRLPQDGALRQMRELRRDRVSRTRVDRS
jgi:hypothetical protein